jgi:hypothetical protein
MCNALTRRKPHVVSHTKLNEFLTEVQRSVAFKDKHMFFFCGVVMMAAGSSPHGSFLNTNTQVLAAEIKETPGRLVVGRLALCESRRMYVGNSHEAIL